MVFLALSSGRKLHPLIRNKTILIRDNHVLPSRSYTETLTSTEGKCASLAHSCLVFIFGVGTQSKEGKNSLKISHSESYTDFRAFLISKLHKYFSSVL